ncbi:unnamed protein product [Amoebophrya sp. A120]|nr:unnamed protein product [Amoebophrya sp. A120]|eukprot:GSA120T00015737001.1
MFETGNSTGSNYQPPRMSANPQPAGNSIDDIFADISSTPAPSTSTTAPQASRNELDNFFSQEKISTASTTGTVSMAGSLGGGVSTPSSLSGTMTPVVPAGGAQEMTGFGSAPPPTALQQAIPEFIKNAKHPVVCCFHLLFKMLCLFAYLFGGYLWSNTVLTYIFCILFLAFDFWTVKNVTGRKLVGLRWWNIIKDDEATGEEVNEWIFESLQDESQLDPLDKNVFWLGTYSWALIWTLFLILNVISLNLSWVVFLVVANVFAWSNLVAFWKCSRDQKDKMQSWVAGAMFKNATGFDLGRLV